MQYDPRHSATPPSPIEPTGFFTGVQIRPLIIGVVADYIGTYVMMYAYFFVYLAQELSKQGEVSSDTLTAYMLTPEGLLTGFAIGALGTAIGGFVAALKADRFEAKHGGLVGAGSLIVTFIEQSLQEQLLPLPEWFRILSIIAIMPAGGLGGYLAGRLKGSGSGTKTATNSAPRTGGSYRP